MIQVIPCLINQEFRITSRILGVFVVPMGLISHKKILVPYTSWFLIYDHKYFEYFVKICSISIYKTNWNFALHNIL